MQQESTQGEQIGEADKQLDTESVGSASPFEIVKVHDVSEAGAGNKVAIPHEAASAGSTAKVTRSNLLIQTSQWNSCFFRMLMAGDKESTFVPASVHRQRSM